ncbi:SMI1/KNR4 family protein [Fibrella forsythiae]|uniref:SMI1/KNR4 family protein n=1 Tax=Fibrella forsythiae TaxID=2817061 RepID=A0ABS3JGQ3_9BACT|nr:SMI1/KNR4 family protein [Fibrella forsythiae]MBO0949194.1 SMI1/KNR4 family protein [Fibrella forsythiae]
MYNQFFSVTERGIYPNDITIYQPSITDSLPAEMINFYQQINGGILKSENCVLTINGEHVYSTESIFDLERVTIFHDYMREVEKIQYEGYYRDDESVPYPYSISDSMLPIASEGERFVCIGVTKNTENKIYYVDMTMGMYAPSETPVIYVADSILSFLTSLGPYI